MTIAIEANKKAIRQKLNISTIELAIIAITIVTVIFLTCYFGMRLYHSAMEIEH
jgi:hypothetical protein